MKLKLFNKAKKIDGDNIAFGLSVAILLVVTCLIFRVPKLQSRPFWGIKFPVEDLDRWIAPSIQGHEREVMRKVIRDLPIDRRENVTYVDDKGNIYGNNLASKKIQVAKPVGNGLYTYDGSEVFPLSNDGNRNKN
jgi:hypothetical protein